MKARRILSIDGGGIRGLVSCTWLAAVEGALTGAGKPGLLRGFDLAAGTSTGAVIACGLGIGLSPEEMGELYRVNRHTIFPGISERLWSRAGRFLVEGPSAPKYDARGLEKVLKKVFGNTRLGDLELPVLITGYDTIARKAILFRSFEPAHRPLRVWEVCRATTASPTYFPAHGMTVTGRRRSMIDGGVVANNPTACAIAEALRKDRAVKNSHELVVLSIGTGERNRSISLEQAREWGALEWATPIIDVLFDGNADSVDFIARQLVGRQYFRMQAELLSGLDDLDDTSSANIAALEALAKAHLATPATRRLLRDLVKLF